MFTLKNFDPGVVKLIVTLATPHAAPVIQSDQYLINFYKNVEKVWLDRLIEESKVTLISIGGGERDFLVRSDLTRDQFADVNVLVPKQLNT